MGPYPRSARDEPEYLNDGELDADAPHDPGEAPCPAETAPQGEAPESELPPRHEEPTETHTTPRRRRRGRPRHARCRVTEVAGDDSEDPARATPDPEPIISDPDEDEEESPPSPTRGGWGPARLQEFVLNTTLGRSSPSPALIPERERQPYGRQGPTSPAGRSPRERPRRERQPPAHLAEYVLGSLVTPPHPSPATGQGEPSPAYSPLHSYQFSPVPYSPEQFPTAEQLFPHPPELLSPIKTSYPRLIPLTLPSPPPRKALTTGTTGSQPQDPRPQPISARLAARLQELFGSDA
ncbi:uncharacterized protein LOC134540088 [Bacillus rossius redtenbacheri]|uniref:uncharacterized protein LOC134540088 n=1 Tax=Bacillus rossius redtenbacheri TaxID=93214 RepID=UPI002FDD99CC